MTRGCNANIKLKMMFSGRSTKIDRRRRSQNIHKPLIILYFDVIEYVLFNIVQNSWCMNGCIMSN